MGVCRYETLLSPLIDGELSESTAVDVRAHLVHCESCRYLLAELTETDRWLENLPQMELSADFDRNVFRRIAAHEEKRNGWRFFIRRLFVDWRLSAAAVAAVVLALLWLNSGKSLRTPTPEEIQMAEQMELFEDYEVVENMDMLENWELIASLKERS